MSHLGVSSWNKTIYRLRNFPHNFSREDLSKAIQEAYQIQPSDFKIHSLSLDLAEGYGPREKVATVTFRSKPAALRESKNQEWSLEITSTSDDNTEATRAYLDTHFRGFTPLIPEESDETCDTDCIFIHGWGGNALGSLTADDPKYAWLRDDLPLRFPNLRVWTYGYGSKLTDENFVSDPFEDAEELKSDLRSFRHRSEKERPIIFIVHSLGGLIFKQAMIFMSRSKNVEDKQNLKLVKGALFFGVPGQGMDVTTLASMVDGLPSQYTLKLLDEEVGFRQRDIQDEDFHRIWPDGGFDIIFFFEKHKTPTVVKTANGWERSGSLSLLVKPSSATFSRYNQRDNDNIVALNKDHSSMVKFSRNDRGEYRKVYTAIHYLLQNMWSTNQGQSDGQGVSKERQHELELQQRFVDELYNQTLQSRTRQISELANGTYEWIFADSDDEDRYVQDTNSKSKKILPILSDDHQKNQN